mmetsp:Transcript_83349/g.147287  ORF Transcript_83349/g.147287 Transcript_83349/m.147287 type:complete len:87 (+) Transcript_83349:2-262(+)
MMVSGFIFVVKALNDEKPQKEDDGVIEDGQEVTQSNDLPELKASPIDAAEPKDVHVEIEEPKTSPSIPEPKASPIQEVKSSTKLSL